MSSRLLDYSTILTPEVFEELGCELGIAWPEWYRAIVLTLLHQPPLHGDWLSGGFLYARPFLIYRDTEAYRTGRLKLDTAVPWPRSYVIVGAHGSGSVVIDTALHERLLQNLDNESGILSTFIDIDDAANSPELFAKLLLESNHGRP